MFIAIALTLFLASATAASGALQHLRYANSYLNRAIFARLAVNLGMAAWFAFAGVWLLAR